LQDLPLANDHFQKGDDSIIALSAGDEKFLGLLFSALEENWQDPHFIIDDYCHNMAMSKSHLYRKIVALSGFSPNSILKEFRLEKAKDLLKKKQYTIAEISFEAGFTSPSYFTKCFKKKYGILPLAYVDKL